VVRTQISLTDDERRLLDVVSSRTGRSMSALIRDAVNQVYGRQEADPADDVRVLAAVAGAWGDREESGEDFVSAVRSGRRLSS
jgi:predicted transcriptional regulator